MKIYTYNITSPYAFVDNFILGTPECFTEYDPIADFGYGVSVDSGKTYATNRSVDKLARADNTTLLGDAIVGSTGFGNDNFDNPTFSAIITYPVPPSPAIENIFGNIIW
jgi:hypothetical protein